MSVTEQDRERALGVAMRLFTGGYQRDHATGVIAQALADERERARAPFLALAGELDAWATENDNCEPTNTDGLLRSITAGRVTRRIAQDIRTAAEEIACDIAP